MRRDLIRAGLGTAIVAAIVGMASAALAGNPLGAKCTAPSECASGFCTDGVCCESAACGAGLTCAEYPCSYYRQQDAGRCRLPLGTPCDASNAAQCAGGADFCVDGVCCTKTAAQCHSDGPCAVCNVLYNCGTWSGTGICGAAPAGKVPSGHMCQQLPGADSTCAAALTCPGVANWCAIPSGTVCKPASCVASAGTTASTCDASGRCITPTATDCAPYGCKSSGECNTTCTTSDDCAGGSGCANGTCVKGGTCSADLSASTVNGASTACAPYNCDQTTGACKASCKTSDDCAAGGSCDTASGHCEAAAASSSGGGCSVFLTPRASSLSSALMAVAAAGLVALRRTGRRCRDR